jgi:hypothetical protein
MPGWMGSWISDHKEMEPWISLFLKSTNSFAA